MRKYTRQTLQDPYTCDGLLSNSCESVEGNPLVTNASFDHVLLKPLLEDRVLWVHHVMNCPWQNAASGVSIIAIACAAEATQALSAQTT